MKVCLKQHPKEVWVAQDHLSSCWVNVREGLKNNAIETGEDGEIVRIDTDRSEKHE
jgi:hypothetical protein